MERSYSKKSTINFVVLGLLALAFTALPFQYIARGDVSLFTAMFGNRTLNPFAYVNTMAIQMSGGGAGYIVSKILCYSVMLFVVFSVVFAIINFIVLLNPHNLMFVAFRNYFAYFFLGLSVVTLSTIMVWQIVSIVVYGFSNLLMFGIGLSALSLLSFAQVVNCYMCLASSFVKVELTAYDRVGNEA